MARRSAYVTESHYDWRSVQVKLKVLLVKKYLLVSFIVFLRFCFALSYHFAIIEWYIVRSRWFLAEISDKNEQVRGHS